LFLGIIKVDGRIFPLYGQFSFQQTGPDMFVSAVLKLSVRQLAKTSVCLLQVNFD